MKVYKWMEQCIVVEGYIRSAVYDLNRCELHCMDKDIRNLIEKVDGVSVDEIVPKLLESELEWFEHLIELEFFIPVPENCYNNFPSLNIVWRDPKPIVEASFHESNSIDHCLEILSSLSCHYATLIIENDLNLGKTLDKHFKKTDLYSLNLLVKNVHKDESFYSDLREPYPVLCDLSQPKITEHDVTLVEENFMPTFQLDDNNFMEAQEHSLYFNRRLHFDENGWVSNTPKSKKSGLNLNEITRQSAREDIQYYPEISYLWNVKKDETDICKNCELRYQCIDKRIPKQRESDGMWYHSSECQYNPYIAKWKWEEGYLSLQDIGVVTNENGIHIDQSIIRNTVRAILKNDEQEA